MPAKKKKAKTKVPEYATKNYRDSPYREILTPTGCRHLLGVGEKSLSKMTKAGMPHVLTSNSYRYSRRQVLEWFESEALKNAQALAAKSTKL